jgi:hypothetical protein
MSRFTVGMLLGKGLDKTRPVGGAQHVARLFVPAYEPGITITVTVSTGARRSRNSDARRRLARMFDQRRVIS